MTDAEVQQFLAETSRFLQVSTIGRTGVPQLSTMGFAMIDGLVHFQGYGTSQKMVNLRRDPRITVMVEDGQSYNSLRGVVIEGRAELIDDTAITNQVMNLIGQRFFGRSEQGERSAATKRITVRVHPERVYSWDHGKLSTLSEQQPAGQHTGVA